MPEPTAEVSAELKELLMKKKPQIVYYGWSDQQSWTPVLTALNDMGLDGIFQGLDRTLVRKWDLKIGGGSGDYFIVDLEEASLKAARHLLKVKPQLKGRIVVVSSLPDTEIVEGIVVSRTEDIADTVLKLVRES